mgnify:CR=1 FL=1
MSDLQFIDEFKQIIDLHMIHHNNLVPLIVSIVCFRYQPKFLGQFFRHMLRSDCHNVH